MLTTFDMDEYVFDALRAGASGFLLKDVPPERLVDGIRAVANGDALLAPSITRRLIEEFVRSGPMTTSPPPALDDLTARELEVLQLICEGLSNRDIAARLRVSANTVAVHRANIMNTLGVHKTAELVVYAIQNGLVTLP
jgi:DNA-binding NarL/FixJ family response regulator